MILEETLNKLLRDAINLILGLNDYSIKAKQPGAPRPTGPYAAVDFVSDTGIGWEQRTYTDQVGPDVDIIGDISGHREIMFSVNFFRASARDNARKARTGLVRDSIQTLFKGVGVGLNDRSDVRDVSEILEDTWEERSQFDIVLNAIGTDTDIIRAIQSVDIIGETQINGNINNITIEVP